MTLHRWTTRIALACAIAFVPATHAADTGLPALTTTQVRIDVDATGRVAAVEPTSKLPAPLADTIRRHVAQWRFDAPRRDGLPVAGTTFARMSVCAMQAPGSGDLAFALGASENGPGMDARMLRPSFFPPMSTALVELGRLDMEAIYEVGTDGRATVVSLTTTPANPGVRRGIEAAFRKWLAPMRFQPEALDGQAVATRVRLPITFTFERADGIRPDRDIRRRIIESHPTCQALLKAPDGDAKPQVALDSPFRLQPSG